MSRTILVWSVLAVAISIDGALAQTWNVDLSDPGTGVRVDRTNMDDNRPNAVTNAGTDATLTVNCGAGVDCAKVSGKILDVDTGNVKLPLTLDGSPPAFSIPQSAAGDAELALYYDSASTPFAKYLLKAGSATGRQRVTLVSTNLLELLSTECRVTGQAVYDADRNLGQIVVAPTGAVYRRGVTTFDENDELEVFVIAHKSLLPLLKVRRSSEFGTRELRIFGEGLTIKTPKLDRQSAGAACGRQKFVLGDFAPGRGEVEIAVQGTDSDTVIGTFDFRVNPLYSGIFSLGGVWTDQIDPAFKLVSNGTDTIITAGEQGDNEFLYSVLFTPYVWGKRDLAKPPKRWYKRVNPTFGVVLDNVDDHGLVGVSIDLPRGFLLTYGQHYRKVSVIDENSGLVEGDVFTGPAEQAPFATSWEDDSFFSVSIDLRVAVKLFASAFRGVAGSAN